MELIHKDLILREIPLFANLSGGDLQVLKERCALLEYKKGQIIYDQGSPASAFYCVVLGRAVIYIQDAQGNQAVLEYLHRGKYFGIISLLTAEPHSVTAKALNDCLLLVIKRQDFDFVLKKIPQLAIDLSRTLSRRLKNKDIHQKTIFESTIISVFSSYSHAGKTLYALNLGLSLKKESHKSVVILDIAASDKIHSQPAKLEIQGDYPVFDLADSGTDPLKMIKGAILKSKFALDLVCLKYNPQDQSCIKRLVAILSILVNDYHYIILDLPAMMDNFVFGVLNQSDLIHILNSPDPTDLKRTHNLVEHLKKEFDFAQNKIKIIINEYKLSRLTYGEEREFLGLSIYATLPKIELAAKDRLVLDEPDAEYAKAVRRISRHLSDAMVGLVLGVGMGYGFCHIGVLKVIEEEKIPIDIISGASIGAVIAALWATGKSAQEILRITEEFKDQKYIWNLVDWTFPTLGFVKGNKLYRFLKKHIGNKTFYDIRLPLKIVASDVRRKESRIFEQGPLIDALMLSCSMPGVFRPFTPLENLVPLRRNFLTGFSFKEELVLDGGVINPLPTEVLFKLGVRKIIAVNVTPSREDILRQYEKIKEQFTQTVRQRKWFSLKQYFREKFKTNILDIIFSSIEVMQSELAVRESQLADVVLHPDTSGMHWLELHRSAEFAKRGEEEAQRNLGKIWQVINE